MNKNKDADEELIEIFEKKALYLEKAIEVISGYYNNARAAKATKLVWLANLGLFSILSEYDLWTYICSYHTSSRKFVQNLYARLVCLGIVETTEDILQMMGKEYHLFFNTLIKDESIKNRANVFKKKLVQFKEENEREFRDVRNYVIAHREHDVSKQMEMLNSIDSYVLMQKNMEYLQLIEELHTLINDAIRYIDNQFDINPRLIESLRS